ncbi:hypothetical protein [uncultured Adlercreutzia sp.]|uniref:hypothetical protein n=1 Tax=uncultured Adlercreutzia sp. TaxID=875803 RepID=UPI0025A61512|nr:hypothetical protein [uncultured Adlercreutzia sp.]
MEWTMITDARLKAYAYDGDGNDWSISFDGYADCETPLGGDGVVLTRNGERVAAVAVEYYGADAEAADYDMDALIAKVVEAVKSIAEAQAAGDADGKAEAAESVDFDIMENPATGNTLFMGKTADGYAFCGAVDLLPSEIGIATPGYPGGSNVVKLNVCGPDGSVAYDYDRALFRPACGDADCEAVAEILAALEAALCKAGE